MSLASVLTIDKNLTIIGPVADKVTISGNGRFINIYRRDGPIGTAIPETRANDTRKSVHNDVVYVSRWDDCRE